MQRIFSPCSIDSAISNADSSVYYTPKEYPSDRRCGSAQPPVRRCSLSKKFNQSRNRYSFRAQAPHTSRLEQTNAPTSKDDLQDEEQFTTARKPSRQYIQNRKMSSAKLGLRRNSSLEVLTAQRRLMDRALRELYASMQELRQANDSPRSRQILERSRSLDDSIIPDIPAPIKMSTLTPMERVAIKGLASQRRRSLRSKSMADKRSVYHSLIPQVFVDDNNIYRAESLGINPWIEQSSRSSAQVEVEMDDTEEPSMDKSYREKYLRREQIYESLENILNEIESFSDYNVPPVHLKTNLQSDQKAKPSPRMTMEVPPSALRSLFKTPKSKRTEKRRSRTNVPEKKRSVAEVSWGPDTEYRSVLTGERFPPITPTYNVFYGQSVSTTSKVIRTLCLAYAYFILGMCVSMIGPALLDISEIARHTADNAYQFLTIRGAGVAVGCVLLGALIRRFDHYMTFAVILTACGVANFSFPALNSYVGMVLVEMLIGLCLGFLEAGEVMLIGLCLGFLEAGVQIVCIEIWQEKNGLYMLAVHFVYGLGTIIGPLIAQPFLGINDDSQDNVTIFLSDTAIGLVPDLKFSDNFTTPSTSQRPEHYFQYAYFIVGGLFLSCAMCQMFIWFWSGECSCKYKTGQLEEISTLYTDFTDTQPTMLVLTALFMFVHVGVEFSYRGLLATYVVQSLGWSRSVGAWITSVTFSTYTLGRGLGFGFSKCLDSGVLLWFNLILIFLALLVELLLVDHYPSVMWITTSVQGLGQSTVLPSCFLWASNKLQVQGITAGILLFIASLGMMVLPGITGALMASFRLAAFQIVPLTGVLVNVAIFLVMYILGRKSENLLSLVKASGSERTTTTHICSTPKTRTTLAEAESLDPASQNRRGSSSTKDKVNAQAGTSSQKHSKFVSLQIHPEYTGSPKCYKVHNGKFTPPTIPNIKVTSATLPSKCPSPSTVIDSPYSMNSFTPLAVMSYLHPNSAR